MDDNFSPISTEAAQGGAPSNSYDSLHSMQPTDASNAYLNSAAEALKFGPRSGEVTQPKQQPSDLPKSGGVASRMGWGGGGMGGGMGGASAGGATGGAVGAAI